MICVRLKSSSLWEKITFSSCSTSSCSDWVWEWLIDFRYILNKHLATHSLGGKNFIWTSNKKYSLKLLAIWNSILNFANSEKNPSPENIWSSKSLHFYRSLPWTVALLHVQIVISFSSVIVEPCFISNVFRVDQKSKNLIKSLGLFFAFMKINNEKQTESISFVFPALSSHIGLMAINTIQIIT